MKIAFKNVGRQKRNWEAEINTDRPDEEVAMDIAKEVNKKGGLMSRDIDIDYTENWNGRIYAGFHKVGTFEEAA